MARKPAFARTQEAGVRRVWLLTLGLAVAGIGLWSGVVRTAPSSGHDGALAFLLLAAGFALAEICVVHFEFRLEAYSFSLSEIPLVLGLFFVRPSLVVLAHLLGGTAVLVLHRRQAPVKLAFNASHFLSCTSVAAIVFHGIGGPDAAATVPIAWLAVFAATIVSHLLASSAIAVAISLSEGRPRFDALRSVIGAGLVASSTNTGAGLVAAVILAVEPRATWLVAGIAAALFVAYRGYASMRGRHQSLMVLYESTRIAQRSREGPTVVDGILRHAAEMFRAERVVVFLKEESGAFIRLAIDSDGRLSTGTTDPDERRLVQHVCDKRTSVLMVGLPEGEPFAAERRRLGIRDAMVVPLFNEDAPLGAMLAANRTGSVSTFTPENLQLFELLGNHASVAVDNAQLIDRLRGQAAENRHQALHDSLTGLPNRTLFRTVVGEVSSRGDRTGSGTVMLIDLDRFKEVNDTLGHHVGDLLLREVAQRLVKLLGETGVVARLGGDEFAILLPGAGRAGAVAAAGEIAHSLEEPFFIDELSLNVGASIGMALYPEHGSEADTLIQRADIAMYMAKEEHGGTQVYEPERDRFTTDRLTLVGDLRTAIAAGGLSLVYQPIVDGRNGSVASVEALCRWEHATRGPIPPDEFIPLAEQTGLIRPLMNFVLDKVVDQMIAWRNIGLHVHVAVNVSARNLLDHELPDAISSRLVAAGIPASQLTVEITESTIMADPARAIAVVKRLSEMGIRISVDDFGTGYSSLSYLSRLPVGQLKLDRSFVSAMLHNHEDAMIVRSTIDLGKNLGLEIVAEGVENEEIADRLRGEGCHMLQGYGIAMPMRPGALLDWVADREQRAGRPVTHLRLA